MHDLDVDPSASFADTLLKSLIERLPEPGALQADSTVDPRPAGNSNELVVPIGNGAAGSPRNRWLGVAAALVLVAATSIVLIRSTTRDNPAAGPPQSIEYVSFGDFVASTKPTFTGEIPLVIKDRFGSTITSHVYIADYVEQMRQQLASTADVRSSVATANLITITFGANELGHELELMAGGASCGGDKRYCVGQAALEMEASYRGLLDDLVSIRPATAATYVLMTQYDAPFFFGDDAPVMTEALRSVNDFICAEANLRRMRCADVFSVINGPDGQVDPLAAGYLKSSDQNTTLKGAEAIARAVVDAAFG